MALLASTHTHERRAHPRHKVLKRAKIGFNSGQSVMDCLMRDLSAGGARLSCDQVALPDRFQLVFLIEREMRDVRVVWRMLNQIGVEFVSPPRRAFQQVL